MRHDGRLLWRHALYRIESNMSLRGTAAWGFHIFQKDCKNLDGPEHCIGQVRQFQEDSWLGIHESKAKRFLGVAIGAHRSFIVPVAGVFWLSRDRDPESGDEREGFLAD